MSKVLFAAFAVSALAASAFADVSFNNFSAGDTFNTGTGATISGPSSVLAANNDQGFQWTSLTTGDVSMITVAMGYVTGTNSCTMRMYDDAGGAIGALRGTWVITGMGSFGSAYTPSAIAVAPGVGITTGGKYWLIADSADDAWLAWNWNSSGDTGRPWYWNNNGTITYGSHSSPGAFRVETVVPEPASIIALGAGALALARRRRRKV